MDKQEDITIEQRDNYFIHVCVVTLQNRTTRAIFPFLLFIGYSSFRLILRGNSFVYFADFPFYYITYRQLLYISIVSMVILFVYQFIVIWQLEVFLYKKLALNIRLILKSILHGLFTGLCIGVSIFYVYCIIFIGILPLLSLKDGFSIYPIIKLITFGLIGFFGLKTIFHILILSTKLTYRQELVTTDIARGFLQGRILEYIFKHKLYKEKTSE